MPLQICRANFGFMHLFENGAARIAGWLNVPEAFIAIRQSKPVFRFGPNHPLGRLFTSKQAQHILDARKDKAYDEKDAFFDTFVDITKQDRAAAQSTPAQDLGVRNPPP